MDLADAQIKGIEKNRKVKDAQTWGRQGEIFGIHDIA